MPHEEHAGSYYAATRNDEAVHMPLAGEHETEVCIIGGGFTGVACALTLAERGHAVTLLEQNRIGWGASGRNGGQLICGFGGRDHLNKHLAAEKIRQLHYRGNQIVKERVEKYAIECDLKYGFIEVALKNSQLDGLAGDIEHHRKAGQGEHFRLVDRDETAEMLGTDAYLGGMLSMIDGHLHPLNLCLGEARAAKGLGAAIFEHSEVTRIVEGAKMRVETQGGAVLADKVLIAGNAYHHLEQQRLSGLIFPAGSFIIATEPLAESLRQRVNPQDFAVCDLNHVLDYYRYSADGRLLFGGRCNYSGKEPKSIQRMMLPRMLEIYPELEGVKIDYEWGGKMGIVVKRVPLIGRLSERLFYSMGYSGHGVSPTHTAAEIIADAMEGNTQVIEAYEKIKHWRIPGSRWFGNQIVALGMLYYRALDMSPL